MSTTTRPIDTLDAFERETLADLIHEAILEHTLLAKLDHLALSKPTTRGQDARLQWQRSHAEYLLGIARKLGFDGMELPPA